MIFTNRNFMKIFIFIFTITILISGCSKEEPGKDAEGMQLSTESEMERIPDQLKEIEDSIEEIIAMLKGPSVSEKDDKRESEDTQGQMQEEESGQGEDKEKSKEQEEGEESKGEDKGGEGEEEASKNSKQGQEESEGESDKDKEQKKDTPKDENKENSSKPDVWKEINSIINGMHYKWNSYLPKAVNVGADRMLVDNFSSALNSLTDTITEKNTSKALLSASHLYSYVPDFYSLYKSSNTSPELKRIRHYTRSASLNANIGKWEQSDSDLENLKSSWALFKNSIQEKDRETASKLDLSIYELDKVISARNPSLSDIKGRITLSNVQELEKSIEENKGQQSQ